MSGGITQLVATGAQDTHLVGQPEISFWQSSYKRHTNFSSVIERQTIVNVPSAGGISSVRFERKGDLLSYCYLAATDSSDDPASVNWSQVVDKVELYIGGQLIDTQHYEFSSQIAPQLMSSSFSRSIQGSSQSTGYFYALKFWFCENWQSALPLVALQYHDVELRFYWSSSFGISDKIEMFSRFVHLDTMERKSFAERTSDYLIQQVQRIPSPGAAKADLTFNHPVKFIATTATNIETQNPRILLQLNGTDVGDSLHSRPHYVQSTAYWHTQFAHDDTTPADGMTNVTLAIPFCLDTSKLQPTGTVNFSRIDSARLVLSKSTFNAPIYAVNYNILRVQNGMGGMLYAN